MTGKRTTSGRDDASEIRRAIQELTTQVRRLEIYQHIAMFSFTFDAESEDAVLQQVAAFLVDHHRLADNAWIYKSSEQRIDLVHRRGPAALIPQLEHLSRGMGSIVGRSISICRSKVISDCSAEPGYPQHPMEPRIGSAMCVPLTCDGCLGAIWLYSETPGRFRQEDLEPVEALASVAAFAVRNVQLQKRLEWLALHDPLTELLNRRGFLQSAEAFAPRRRCRKAILFIDIDYFKKINADHGHARADQVLREVGLRLRTDVGPDGVVGRWGGEEFLAVISVPAAELQASADDIVRKIRSRQAAGVDVTISLGATFWSEETLEEAAERADQALLRAKEQGRNRAVVSS